MAETMALALRPATAPAPAPAPDVEKKIQKAVGKRTLDFTSPYIHWLQGRMTSPCAWHQPQLQPCFSASLSILPPIAYVSCPASSLPSKLAMVSWGKARSPVNAVAWTPDGRRCIVGHSNGEFSLWGASTMVFESAMQAHETQAIRSITYTHNQQFLLSTDDMGRAKIFKPNLELLDTFHPHREPCRALSFCPSDFKFTTASDDSTIRVHDFVTMRTERTMTGHGGDARAVDWHPSRGVLASGSKDATIKLWDVRTGDSVATLHGHKSGVLQVHWNLNGNWLLSCSRDSLLRVYDARTLRCLVTYRGHSRDATSCAWHPVHEELFSSGSFDGSLMHWLVSRPEPQLQCPGAHDREIGALAWHPIGHALLSGSIDQGMKLWARARPGDLFQAGHDGHSGAPGALHAEPTPHAYTPPTTAPGAVSSIPGIGISTAPAVIPGIGAAAPVPLVAPKVPLIPGLAPPAGGPPGLGQGQGSGPGRPGPGAGPGPWGGAGQGGPAGGGKAGGRGREREWERDRGGRDRREGWQGGGPPGPAWDRPRDRDPRGGWNEPPPGPGPRGGGWQRDWPGEGAGREGGWDGAERDPVRRRVSPHPPEWREGWSGNSGGAGGGPQDWGGPHGHSGGPGPSYPDDRGRGYGPQQGGFAAGDAMYGAGEGQGPQPMHRGAQGAHDGYEDEGPGGGRYGGGWGGGRGRGPGGGGGPPRGRGGGGRGGSWDRPPRGRGP